MAAGKLNSKVVGVALTERYEEEEEDVEEAEAPAESTETPAETTDTEE